MRVIIFSIVVVLCLAVIHELYSYHIHNQIFKEIYRAGRIKSEDNLITFLSENRNKLYIGQVDRVFDNSGMRYIIRVESPMSVIAALKYEGAIIIWLDDSKSVSKIQWAN